MTSGLKFWCKNPLFRSHLKKTGVLFFHTKKKHPNWAGSKGIFRKNWPLCFEKRIFFKKRSFGNQKKVSKHPSSVQTKKRQIRQQTIDHGCLGVRAWWRAWWTNFWFNVHFLLSTKQSKARLQTNLPRMGPEDESNKIVETRTTFCWLNNPRSVFSLQNVLGMPWNSIFSWFCWFFLTRMRFIKLWKIARGIFVVGLCNISGWNQAQPDFTARQAIERWWFERFCFTYFFFSNSVFVQKSGRKQSRNFFCKIYIFWRQKINFSGVFPFEGKKIPYPRFGDLLPKPNLEEENNKQYI